MASLPSPVVSKVFGPSTDAPTAARKFLRDALRTWHVDGCGEVAELLATELVTNVVRHVGSPMTLRAMRLDDTIRVEVEDRDPRPPVRRMPTPESGHGLSIVDGLATNWGVTPSADGKAVWFEIEAATK